MIYRAFQPTVPLAARMADATTRANAFAIEATTAQHATRSLAPTQLRRKGLESAHIRMPALLASLQMASQRYRWPPAQLAMPKQASPYLVRPSRAMSARFARSYAATDGLGPAAIIPPAVCLIIVETINN